MTSSLLIIMIAWLYGYSSIWGPLLVAVLWLGLTVWGVFDMRLRYFGKIWYKAPNNRHQEIALTFDDGPTPYTSQVLDLLDAYEMRATFFCIGKQIDRYPDIARKILAKGHSIGNHSYSHAKNIGFFSSQEMEREIRETDLALAKATQSNGSLYRPPFGVTNPKVIKACLAQKKHIIGWSIRSLDTVIRKEDRILNRIFPRLQPGDIVLLHDTSARTVQVLERLMIKLKENNLRSVTVERLLKMDEHE